MSILFDFLQKNTIAKSESLPLVHTTRARHLRKILSQGKIEASECDVFKGENLNYFFVGRPSFKFSLDADAEYWQLPICFVMSFSFKPIAKRLFPFDSGGFVGGKVPKFIADMALEDFDVSLDAEAPEKIIGTFFGGGRAYFRLKPRKNDQFLDNHDLSMLEAEILALHKLSSYRNSDFDDRQFSIEYQTEGDVYLRENKVEALIVPSPYLDDDSFWDQATNVLGCEILAYDCYPLNPSTYYYGIYSRVESFLFSKGYLK